MSELVGRIVSSRSTLIQDVCCVSIEAINHSRGGCSLGTTHMRAYTHIGLDLNHKEKDTYVYIDNLSYIIKYESNTN